MKTNIVSNWWSLTLSGIIAIFFAFLAFYNPETLLTTIISIFGIIVLIVGIAMLIGTIGNIRNKQPYAAELIWSILTIIVGGILTFYTSEAVKIFVIIVGIWAILIGALQIYFMTLLEAPDKNRTPFLINGLISIIFGVILFFNPFSSAKFLLIISGILALIMGIFLIVLSFKVKNLEKKL